MASLTPITLAILPEKKATTAKVEYRAVLASSWACALSCPAPPRPPSALNIPGQRKHTRATTSSCTIGEAYQSSRLPTLKPLYIHPVGRETGWPGATGSSTYGAGASFVTGTSAGTCFSSDMFGLCWLMSSLRGSVFIYIYRVRVGLGSSTTALPREAGSSTGATGRRVMQERVS